MRAPTSAILAETFIQHMEHKHTILKTHEIIAHYRHVDDILIIHDQKKKTLNKHFTNSTTYNYP
jgi:hypothetical protein